MPVIIESKPERKKLSPYERHNEEIANFYSSLLEAANSFITEQFIRDDDSAKYDRWVSINRFEFHPKKEGLFSSSFWEHYDNRGSFTPNSQGAEKALEEYTKFYNRLMRLLNARNARITKNLNEIITGQQKSK